MAECPHCGTLKTEKNGYCATANFESRKAERRASMVKVVSPIKKVSTKRAGQNKEYLKLNREYLALYPVCEVVECHRMSTCIHHLYGRQNDNLTDVNNFLAVCNDCHERIHSNPEWAKANGYMITRST